jgi:hypothetical protein
MQVFYVRHTVTEKVVSVFVRFRAPLQEMKLISKNQEAL